MSGAVKGIKKVFKKVLKTTKKVLPIALGVGAIVFTAGAAMGALPSWGSAITSLTGSGSVLTNTLAGAVTQAGYGAALGMATSAITGGDISDGAGYGALAGAATGGVMGAAGMQTDPFSGLNDDVPATGIPAPGGGAPTTPMSGAATTAPGPMGAATPVPNASPPGFFDQGGFLERNGELIGSAVKGLGGGLLSGAEAEDAAKSDVALIRLKHDLAAQNYASDGSGLLTDEDMAYMQQGQRPSPVDAFDPRLYGGEYAYNPKTGKIEFVAKG